MRHENKVGKSTRHYLVNHSSKLIASRAARPKAVITERTRAHFGERHVGDGNYLGLIFTRRIDGGQRSGGAATEHIFDTEHVGGAQGVCRKRNTGC